MDHSYWAPAAVGIAFWVMVTAAAVTAIITDYRKRQAAVDVLRVALEHGQQVEAGVVEKLLAREKWERTDPRLVAQYLRVAAVITIAAGIGVALLAFFIAKIAPPSFYPILGAGVLVVCVGIGLLVAAPLMEKTASVGTSGNRPA